MAEETKKTDEVVSTTPTPEEVSPDTKKAEAELAAEKARAENAEASLAEMQKRMKEDEVRKYSDVHTFPELKEGREEYANTYSAKFKEIYAQKIEQAILDRDNDYKNKVAESGYENALAEKNALYKERTVRFGKWAGVAVTVAVATTIGLPLVAGALGLGAGALGVAAGATALSSTIMTGATLATVVAGSILGYRLGGKLAERYPFKSTDIKGLHSLTKTQLEKEMKTLHQKLVPEVHKQVLLEMANDAASRITLSDKTKEDRYVEKFKYNFVLHMNEMLRGEHGAEISNSMKAAFVAHDKFEMERFDIVATKAFNTVGKDSMARLAEEGSKPVTGYFARVIKEAELHAKKKDPSTEKNHKKVEAELAAAYAAYVNDPTDPEVVNKWKLAQIKRAVVVDGMDPTDAQEKYRMDSKAKLDEDGKPAETVAERLRRGQQERELAQLEHDLEKIKGGGDKEEREFAREMQRRKLDIEAKQAERAAEAQIAEAKARSDEARMRLAETQAQKQPGGNNELLGLVTTLTMKQLVRQLGDEGALKDLRDTAQKKQRFTVKADGNVEEQRAV